MEDEISSYHVGMDMKILFCNTHNIQVLMQKLLDMYRAYCIFLYSEKLSKKIDIYKKS